MKILNELEKAYTQKKPFVIYKKPNESCVFGLFQNTRALHYVKDYTEEGFVFAPFQNEKPVVLIPKRTSVYMEEEIDVTEYINEKLGANVVSSSKEAHIALVAKGVEAINSGMFQKVVLSRKETLLVEDIDVVDVYKKLLYKYPTAMVYIWFHPEIGLWLGATPETLIKVKNNQFETMALAGTQSYNGTLEVVWEQKEIEEQQLVTDYIVTELEKVCNTVKTSKVTTVKAGNLLHLRTAITGIIGRDQGENNLKHLIKVLHPTPAVCGMPKEAAKSFILDNEGYDRGYYTGFLGELHGGNDTTNLFVNLRCMELKEERVHIYVGGGIMGASIPEKEWEETVAKAKVMKYVL